MHPNHNIKILTELNDIQKDRYKFDSTVKVTLIQITEEIFYSTLDIFLYFKKMYSCDEITFFQKLRAKIYKKMKQFIRQ